MAKKNKGTFSYLETQQALEKVAENCTKENIIYELLRIFCGYGDATIGRIIDGRGNDAKDGKTILVKKLIAYRATEDGVSGDNHLYDLLEAMQKDNNITKKEPRLYVVSDGKRIMAYDPKEEDLYDNDIALLWKDFEFFKPLAGIEKFRNIEEADADVKSAEMMAKIYDDIRRYNDVHDKEQIHNINVFMTRLLFCYFAEDTGLFPIANMFTTAIRQDTKNDGSDLAEFLGGIFDIMAIKDKEVRASLPTKITQFPYVNGGLFKTHIPIPVLSRRTRMLMLKCGEYNWAEINPDIFGSMIQAVINPDDRAGLGIHYTSVPNIMKVIRPLFLDELTEEYIKAKDDIKKLKALMLRLSKIKFFDPACGSGNFLIIAYKSIRELEIQIWKRLRELRSTELPFSFIELTQFYGIEIDEYACDTAQLSLWLAKHQADNLFHKELGSHVDALPLGKSGNVICGNACRLDWNTVCPHTADEEVYVMGNPPYLGSRNQEESHKQDMEYVFENNYKSLDYVSCWFFLGAQYIKQSSSKCAFVSTNSICQGEQVALIWKRVLVDNIEVAFAHKSFKWVNNAKYNAGVTVVIVGLKNKDSFNKKLYDGDSYELCQNISPYLIKAGNIFIESASKPISDFPLMNFGNMPADGGMLLLTTEEKNTICQQDPIVEKFIKPLICADEMINGGERWCLWLYNQQRSEYEKSTFITNRIEQLREIRLKSSRPQLAEVSHLFAQITQPMNCNYIIIPRHSSENRVYIPIDYKVDNSIAHDSCLVIGTNEIYIFGIITSRIHHVWIRAIGGALETRIRYSAQIDYNTFPFPKITKEQKERLTALAEEILLTRENHTEMTLGEMYNPETMPDDLKEAHRALDIAVEQCYRLEPFTSDDERLEYLFKLYEKMTKKK